MTAHDEDGILHIVVSCKSRKTLDIPARLHVSALAAGHLGDRVARWTHALEVEKAPLVAAGSLYAGDHWKVVRDLDTNPALRRRKVWIVSAGYGLIAFDQPIKPYSATFVHPHPETVAPDPPSYDAREWWAAMSEWDVGQGRPRTLADLSKRVRRGKGALLLALSEPYAVALASDIQAAVDHLGDRLALICAGLSGTSAAASKYSVLFGDALMPAQARLKAKVGMRGAMQGLNARIAAKAVADAKDWYPSAARLRAHMGTWLRGTPPLAYRNNLKMTDQEVIKYISERVKEGGRTSRSRLLAELRSSGQACEQLRFAGLYNHTISSAPIKERLTDEP